MYNAFINVNIKKQNYNTNSQMPSYISKSLPHNLNASKLCLRHFSEIYIKKK